MSPIAPRATMLLTVCLCVFVCVDAAILPFRTPVYIENENALSPVAKYGAAPAVFEVRDWVRIKNSGPRMNRVSPGGRLELECEANGSPPPSVQWFHNAAPASQEMDENNSIGGLRLGTVRSRLVVDCATPRHQGTYTCVATAGTESVISQQSFVFVQGNNASGLLPSCEHASTTPPRILTWSPSTMETIGNDVVLPCISTGSPRPQLYWIDSQNNLITSRPEGQSDNRFKIMDSGDLLISAVRWSDMGHFTCVAESPLGRDSVTTFLYPMAKDR